MRLITRRQIENAVVARDLVDALEGGFVACSRGEVKTPQITLVDLTGLAIQDIEIAKLACARLLQA